MRANGKQWVLRSCLGGFAGLLLLTIATAAFPQGIIIDHTCTDLSAVPDTWINEAKENLRVHYAHTSHGEQITTGLGRLETANPLYNSAVGAQTLPAEAGALCVYDGVDTTDYVEQDDYFDRAQNVLNNNASLNVSIFCWCRQMDWESAGYVNNYLNAMNQLEVNNPGVTFVYMTGNAQGMDAEGLNRYQRNRQIRDYCRDNNKALFDFADIECWHNGTQHTVDGIPVEHPRYYNPGGPGHTTYESCDNKGKAFWWMMARLAGWEGDGSSPGSTTPPITLYCDKEFFQSAYDSIVIMADILATWNFTPYIRFTLPDGSYLYLTAKGGLVSSLTPYMEGPLTAPTDITGYTLAVFEFSGVPAGTYTLESALVGSAGIIGGISSTTLIVQ